MCHNGVDVIVHPMVIIRLEAVRRLQESRDDIRRHYIVDGVIKAIL